MKTKSLFLIPFIIFTIAKCQELQNHFYFMGTNWGYPLSEVSVDVVGGDFRIGDTHLLVGTNVMVVNVDYNTDYNDGDFMDNSYTVINFFPINARYILNTNIKTNTKYYKPKYAFMELKLLPFIQHKSLVTDETISELVGPQIRAGIGIDFFYHKVAKLESYGDEKSITYTRDAEDAVGDKRPWLLTILNPNLGFRLGYSFKPSYLNVDLMEKIVEPRHTFFLELRLEFGAANIGVCKFK